MKNEIGRKLTSLTIMAIMFAGGMAIGVPSFMPEAASDLSSTDGMLTVSTTTLQGSAILEIVVNDPDVSDTTVDINSGPSVSVGGTSLDMSQAINGKWYLYVVDASAAVLAEAQTDTGLEYGGLCEDGLGISANTTNLIVGTGTTIYANVYGDSGTSVVAGGCLDADNARTTTDDAGATSRMNLTAAVLQNAPALSNHDDKTAGETGIDLGQRGHGLNESGYGSWPYIVAQDLNEDTIIDYGGDSITVTYANTDGETSIAIANENPSDSTNVHLTLTDPALNIDPTTADIWEFGLSGGTLTTYFSNNGTDTALADSDLFELDFRDNGSLTADTQSYIVAGASALTVVAMTETGANTGVFESFDATGAAEFLTIDEAAADSISLFSYGGNTVSMIITYNDATITMDSDGAWEPATAITISVNDPDANKNPTSAETLDIGDETEVIPTIKMGSPLTLAASGSNPTNLAKGAANHISGVIVGCTFAGTGCTVTGGGDYTLQITNTTDNSERLRIIHSAETNDHAADLQTWINVTTGHTRADLIGLAGTVVLNYDVTGPCALLTCTAVSVYLTDSGTNETNNPNGLIDVNTSGNDQAGVYDLDDGTQFIVDSDTSAQDTFTTDGSASASALGSALVGVAFKLIHAAGNDLDADADYAIAADFCNFDQNNGSLTHNCIYRLEASETGPNTGIFEGTVEYINLVNSTSANGGHAGNGYGVASLLGYVNGDALSVVLMDAVSGSDSVRVVYNDTDSFQVATKIGAQLETSVHTGTIDLDADTYGVSDIATITIVDADWNQDSSIRDTYTNSTTTFQVTLSTTSGSVTTEQKPFSSSTITAIETGPSTGVFVATFLIPDFKGADLDVTYYESKNAGSSAVTISDIATITSNTGSVSFDRSVYPVPWTANDLSDGAGNLSVNTEAGDVTVWITITDVDETGDTMTVGGSSVGKITVTIGSDTCFSAGGLASYDYEAGISQETGPLSEVVIGSSTYETSVTISENTNCGTTALRDVISGDVIQVAYVDQADDSGVSSTQYDSSTFDLRTGSLSVDKDVYVLGSDMVITLTDPDLNLDSSSTETYAMSIIEWDSSADSSELLNTSAAGGKSGFSSNPSSIEETGSDTGVFQTVTTLPSLSVTASGSAIEFGEAVTLTYVDVGLSGQNNVGDDALDVEAYFSISNFGALIELDKAVYNWTDTVYVTVTAPDHNVNSAAEETIGTSALPLQASTRNGQMCTTATSKYFVGAETGPDTGIFTSEIALLGYDGDQAHNSPTDVTQACSQSDSTANEILTSGQTDGISVSYEYTDAVVVVASASIMFNIGEISFDSSSASAGGSAVVSLTQPDENTNSAVIQTLSASVFSDSDSGGLSLTLSETDEDTGVFEATVFFTTDAATSGSNLRVSEGDTVTVEFTDKTLPEPYADSDTLTLASTLTIGTAFPPLERAPAANARVVDAFGASVAEVTVDQQVQIAADVSNGQSKDQAFAYLVQVQDENGVTVSLAWITGSLTAGQSMSPALSWTPGTSGSYTATVFVWESVDNPTALSPTTSVTINVV